MPSGLNSANSHEEKDARTKRLFLWLKLSVLAGIVVVLIYSVNRGTPLNAGASSPRVLAILGSLMMASLAALGFGALVGFLFGVPRYKTERSVSAASPSTAGGGDPGATVYKPNTNLEEISDWLTKLFVGATLVELGKIPDLMARFGRYFAVIPEEEHIIVSSAIYFGIVGFFIAFFYASLELTDTLNLPSSLQTTFSTRAPLAESSTTDTLKGKEGEALGEARSALADTISTPAVLPPVTGADVTFAVGELTKLAERYEGIRQEMSPGDERTIKMEGVVAQMRLVEPAALQERARFQSSVIAGERLACIVMLQLRPDEGALSWLVDRFRVDRPFVQYHAALALRTAGRQLVGQAPRVKEAIQNAVDILDKTVAKNGEPGASRTSDRQRLLTQALREFGER